MATSKRFTVKNGLDNNNKTITNVDSPILDSDAATRGFARNASNLNSGTLAPARLPAFTGDVTKPLGSATLSLSAEVIASLSLANNSVQPADIASIESIISAIAPTGGLNTTITIPLFPYGVNAYAFSDLPLLGRYFPYDLIVSDVYINLEDAPTGSPFIVDIKKNGSSIFSSLLTVADGQIGLSTYSFNNPSIIFETGDLITFDVTQPGATTPGRYPVLTIEGIRGDVQSVVVPLLPIGINAVATTDQALLGRSFSYDFQIDKIILTLDEAPTGSAFEVDIKLNTTSIFGTKLLTVDSEETSSITATPYTLITTPTIFAKGDLVTFSITQPGTTTPGKYPVVAIIGREI